MRRRLTLTLALLVCLACTAGFMDGCGSQTSTQIVNDPFPGGGGGRATPTPTPEPVSMRCGVSATGSAIEAAWTPAVSAALCVGNHRPTAGGTVQAGGCVTGAGSASNDPGTPGAGAGTWSVDLRDASGAVIATCPDQTTTS